MPTIMQSSTFVKGKILVKFKINPSFTNQQQYYSDAFLLFTTACQHKEIHSPAADKGKQQTVA